MFTLYKGRFVIETETTAVLPCPSQTVLKDDILQESAYVALQTRYLNYGQQHLPWDVTEIRKLKTV